MKNNKIEFAGYIPPIQSAIKIGNDGARLQIDIPESENLAITKLVAFARNKALKITVEPLDE